MCNANLVKRLFYWIKVIGMAAVILLAAIPLHFAQGGTPRFVKPAVSGSGNCSTWTNACLLQTALTNAVTGDEIWVAAGTYKPTTGTDPAATFQLKNGVAVYGGFAGTESLRSQRNPAVNIATLSGDIGAPGESNGNSYHVVTGANGATLDGFTITAGNADADPMNTANPNNWGGGMYIGYNSPTLSNIIFTGNFAGGAGGGGGGLYNTGAPTLTNVTFTNNSASHGGGMYNEGNATLTNVIFSYNSTYSNGGGLNNVGASPTLTNITFDHNSAGFTGGGMYNLGSPLLLSVTFSSNFADSEGGGVMLYNGGSPTFVNVTFSGNTAGQYGGGMRAKTSGSTSMQYLQYPLLANVTFSGNTAGTSGGAINVEANGLYDVINTTVNNAVFWGNTPANDQLSSSRASIHVNDSVVQNGWYTGSNILVTDPHLGQLGSYGGFTQTIPLTLGSSALNTGNDTTCYAADQRGVARPQDGNCDMGAFEVDTTAPVVSAITRLDANPTSLSNVNFQVTFSEAVTGVAAADFLPTTSGVAGAAVTAVNGTGKVWTVTVNTGSGNGTLSLIVPDGAMITDLALNPAGNLPYTGGEPYTVNRNVSIYLPVIQR